MEELNNNLINIDADNNETSLIDIHEDVRPSNKLKEGELEKRSQSLSYKKRSVFASNFIYEFIALYSFTKKKNKTKKTDHNQKGVQRNWINNLLLLILVFLGTGIYFAFQLVTQIGFSNNEVSEITKRINLISSVGFGFSIAPTLINLIYTSNVYIGVDNNETLESLPISRFTKFISKFLINLILSFILCISIMLPSYIYLLITKNIAVGNFFYSIMFLILFNTFGSFISGSVTLILNKIIKKTLVVKLLSTFITLLIIYIYPTYSFINTLSGIKATENPNFSFFLNFYSGFFAFDKSTYLSFLLLIGLLLVGISILFISYKFFFKTINETSKSNKFKKLSKKSQDNFIDKNIIVNKSIFKCYQYYEQKTLFKTGFGGYVQFIIYIMIAISFGLGIYFSIVFRNYMIASNITTFFIDFNRSSITGYVIFIATLFMFLLGPNIALSTNFSKDSKSLLFLRSLNFDGRKFVLSKIFIYSMFALVPGTIFILTCSLICGVLLEHLIMNILIFVFISILSCFISLHIDILRPKLNVTNNINLLNNNLNSFLVNLVLMGFCFVCSIPFTIAYTMSLVSVELGRIGFTVVFSLLNGLILVTSLTLSIFYIFKFSKNMANRICSIEL